MLQSEATRKMYSICLTDLMEYVEVSDYDDLLKMTPMEIQNHIIDHVMNMRNKQLSCSTISGRTSAIKQPPKLRLCHKFIWHSIVTDFRIVSTTSIAKQL